MSLVKKIVGGLFGSRPAKVAQQLVPPIKPLPALPKPINQSFSALIAHQKAVQQVANFRPNFTSGLLTDADTTLKTLLGA